MTNAAPSQPVKPDERPHTPAEDVIGIVVAFTVIAVVALALAQPWLPRLAPGGMLNRYAPLHDGSSFLMAQYDSAGKAVAWQSHNVAVLPPLRAFAGQLRKAPREAIEHHFGRTEETSSNQVSLLSQFDHLDIIETRLNTLDSAGILSSTASVTVRAPEGEYLVSLFQPDLPNPDIIFDPPVLGLSADLRQDSTWQSEGTLNNGVYYTYQGHVVATGVYSGTAGRFEECVQVETSFILSNGQERLADQRQRSWYCAGTGLVEEQTLDAADKVTMALVLASTNQTASAAQTRRVLVPNVPKAADTATVTAQAATTQTAEIDFDAWQLTRVGRLGQDVNAGPGTIPPLWIPGVSGDPPLVLVAGYGGDLTAYDAAGGGGTVRWQFHTQGRIYSPPGYDPLRHRIYFGATDKRLYALDAHGLFLWSFETGDNIASQPLVVDIGDGNGVVIFGSEDRNIYAVDANNGQLRWMVRTGGAVVSSAALHPSPSGRGEERGGEGESRAVVIIGSDDGGVYALDPATGEQAWLYSAGDAIEAPIVVQAGVVYAASRDNSLYALDAATGAELWIADGGDVLRAAPTVGNSGVYIVNDAGTLSGFDRQSGRRLWATVERSYVGPPVALTSGNGDAILVAAADGTVYRFNSNGTRQEQWDIADAMSSTDDPASLELGLSVSSPGVKQEGSTSGDVALWFTDRSAVLRRLGPKTSGMTPLALAWAKSTTENPFKAYLYASAATPAYDGRVVVVDSGRGIHLIDPTRGDVRTLGRLDAPEATAYVEPVVSGDTLLIVLKDTLYAVSLKDGQTLWQVQGVGATYRPVTVSGDTVLWLTQRPSGDQQGNPQTNTGVLYAIDLAQGEVRWQHTLRGFSIAGGALVAEHAAGAAGAAGAAKKTVFISTPPTAFDLSTGKQLWKADIAEFGQGSPALSVDGDLLFVGLLDSARDSGVVAALDTSNGTVRWRADLTKTVLSPFDQLWVHENNVIAPTYTGQVIAFDTSSGMQRWAYQPGRQRFGNVTLAAAPGDSSGAAWLWLLQQNGEVLALDAATGQRVAQFSDIALNLADYSFTQRAMIAGNHVVIPHGYRLTGLKIP